MQKTDKTNLFKSALQKRSSLTPRQFLVKRLGISEPTATKYIHDPTQIRLCDYIRLGFNADEMEEMIK